MQGKRACLPGRKLKGGGGGLLATGSRNVTHATSRRACGMLRMPHGVLLMPLVAFMWQLANQASVLFNLEAGLLRRPCLPGCELKGLLTPHRRNEACIVSDDRWHAGTSAAPRQT
jgi:hypothetical protein